MQELSLVAWGKNYKEVENVKSKVGVVAVGENHLIFGSRKEH